MANRNLTEHVKIGLAVAAIVAACAAAVMDRLKARFDKDGEMHAFLTQTPIFRVGKWSFNVYQSFVAGLMVLALFGTLNYNRFNKELFVDGFDQYDTLHYYVNPKYFDELGYFRLLPAMIIADYETGTMCGDKAPVYLAQNDGGYFKQSVRHALASEKEIKSHFTEERWQQFKHDVITIQRSSRKFGCKTWRQLLQDHGFNGAPAWVLVARPIVNLIPVESIKYCAYLDLVWVLVMLGAVFWAFGARTMMFAWIFIGICYSFRWPTITWAVLRYDWFATMVIGVCMTKKKKYEAAGAFFAYATLMRYFPGLWLFGIAAKGIHALITNSDVSWKRFWLRIPMRYYKMALGFFAMLIFVVSLTAVRDGMGIYKQSLDNMSAHVDPENLSSMRQGLVIALTWRGETDQLLISAEKKQMVADISDTVRIAGILMMILLGLFMSRAKDWEVVGLGLIPYFWLTTSSYYYYSMRMTAVVIHAADPKKPRNLVGLIILFGIEVFCHVTQVFKEGNRYFLVSFMGVLLTGYSITMMGFLGFEWWKGRPKKQELETETETELGKEQNQ